jgi:hypothetical protein
MKHVIKRYSSQLNESIGKGSIVLIKGKPDSDGKRNLYVTSITGYAEIKPGAIMVFLGDQIYRVKHNGPKQFSGIKVDFRSEFGLKQALNMRQNGVPSVVLNNNKTPFHWITLKHIDIGTALKEVENLLPGLNLILESDDAAEQIRQENWDKFLNWAAYEFIKLIDKQESAIVIDKLVESSSYPDSEDLQDSTSQPAEFYYEVYLKNDMIPKDLVKFTIEENLYDFGAVEGAEFMDTLNIKHNTFDLSMHFTLDYSYEYERDNGDWDTPSYVRFSFEVEHTYLDDIVIAGVGLTNLDPTIEKEFKKKIENKDAFLFMPLVSD